MEFLSDTQGDVAAILRRFDVDTAALRKALNQELENLKSGNTGRPSFPRRCLTQLNMPGA